MRRLTALVTTVACLLVFGCGDDSGSSSKEKSRDCDKCCERKVEESTGGACESEVYEGGKVGSDECLCYLPEDNALGGGGDKCPDSICQ